MRWATRSPSSSGLPSPPDVRDPIDEITGLRPVERARLERFARLFERIDASRYVTFAEVPGPDVEIAEAEATRLLGSGSRRDAAKAAVGMFVDEATPPIPVARR